MLWLILALLLVAIVIWVGGPYLAFGDFKPLESGFARIVAIVLVVVLWGFKGFLRELKAVLASNKLAAQVARQEDPRSTRASAEGQQMRQRFEEAIEALRKSKSRKGRINLYELPWYIIIGPPGAGKTTAIVNSGLNFPLAQKFGKEALRGVGGTRNCDWWFTDQAILLDTAGSVHDAGLGRIDRRSRVDRVSRPAEQVSQAPTHQRRAWSRSVSSILRRNRKSTARGMWLPSASAWTSCDST